MSNISERFMAPFAEHSRDNTVVGIDAEGFVQRLLLFEHCIIPSTWLKDVQMLLKMVDPKSLCELLDSNALSFYIDSTAVAELGQAGDALKDSTRNVRLRADEFYFSMVKGRDDDLKIKQALQSLATTDGVSRTDGRAVAERIEAALLEPKGLELHSKALQAFYEDLRAPDSTLVHELIRGPLQSLGAKSSRLKVAVEEIAEESFKITSNLTTEFGLSAKKTREMGLRALMNLSSVHVRLAHMGHFSALLGMNESEQEPWEIKVDALTKMLVSENHLDRQFLRIAKIAGIGERALFTSETLNLQRLIEVRRSDELRVFRSWLRQTNNKSDAEVRERISSIRGKVGNALQSAPGKTIRLMLSSLPNFIPNSIASLTVGLAMSAADSFLLERILPRDSVLAILDTQYPAIFE